MNEPHPTRPVHTKTVAELAAALLALPDQEAYVIASDPRNGWYLNIEGLTPNDEGDNYAVVIETTDDFDTRQW